MYGLVTNHSEGREKKINWFLNFISQPSVIIDYFNHIRAKGVIGEYGQPSLQGST